MPYNAQTFAAIEAKYNQDVLPQYKGNKLIEALPVEMSDAELLDKLEALPHFDPAQRKWETHKRMKMTAQLLDVTFPLRRHVELARLIETMMYSGYLNRSFRSAIETLNTIHDAQSAGTLLKGPNHGFASTAMTKALLGCPGAGKSSTIRRVLSLYPQVIHHPSHQVFQVPYLFIETPHDGTSIKGLAHGIFRRLDEVVPGADYYRLYCDRPRVTDEALLGQLSRVLSLHHVGLLVCDEIQNVLNAHKNKQSVMTLLVSASNEFGVPILFVGTHKARTIMELDFRQARRSANVGIGEWDRFKLDPSPAEWNVFVQLFWDYQWTRKFVPLTPELSEALYAYSQGIPDIVLKLFVAAQNEAMRNGSEELSAELFALIARTTLSSVKGGIDAIRTNDISALAQYPDLAHVRTEDLPPANLWQTARAPGIAATAEPGAGITTTSPHSKVTQLKRGNTSPGGKVVTLQNPDLRNIADIAQGNPDQVKSALKDRGLLGDVQNLIPS